MHVSPNADFLVLLADGGTDLEKMTPVHKEPFSFSFTCCSKDFRLFRMSENGGLDFGFACQQLTTILLEQIQPP